MNINQVERERMVQSILAHPEYMDPKYVMDSYRKLGLEVIPDPFSADIVAPIKKALHAGKAWSVVRIGDGEINLLSYGAYPDTVNLDRHVVERIIAMQQDSFSVNRFWMMILRDLMAGALSQADMIGVVGLWRPQSLSVDELAQLFLRNYRGISGQWRAIDFMLHRARQGFFKHKIIASAHLYFALLNHLDMILSVARKVFLVSNREEAMIRMKKRYPNIIFESIPVGKLDESELRCEQPHFLSKVESMLPHDLTGCLGLVGAGPWAEIYCTWIKQRGGVGVDIGSGFDLLDGQLTRPIHQIVGLDKVRRYEL